MAFSRAFVGVWAVRACLVVLGLSMMVLVFGPYGDLPNQYGISDKDAHSLAFFALCAAALAGFPRVRWTDIAIGCLAIGCAIEVAQPLIGREGSLNDFLADVLGVGFCVIPILAKSLRQQFRDEGHETHHRRRRSDRPRSHSHAHSKGHSHSHSHSHGHQHGHSHCRSSRSADTGTVARSRHE